jgi:hypothetical protein
MEDVLAVYTRPYDPKRPVVCLDEMVKELHGTPKGVVEAKPGKTARQDYEYERNGGCNLFMAVEPLAGKRFATVTDRHTGADFAEQLRFVVEDCYPDAEKVVLVTDNLNVHNPGCLFDVFEPARAAGIMRKIEWRYTPEHASWLNMAEIELSVVDRRCLNRRMPTKDFVAEQVAAWNEKRNAEPVKIDWQFKPADARIKLKRLYPNILKSTPDTHLSRIGREI